MPDTVATDQQVQQDSFTQSQQDTSRQQLYERYYGSQTPQISQDPTSSGGDAATDDNASVVATTDTTAQVDPVATSTDTAPPAPQFPPEMLQVLQSMQQELQQTRAELATLRQPAQQQVDPATEARWVTLLKEGKVAEAESALADSVAARVQEKIQQPVAEQTMARARAGAEIETFVTNLRTQNPDLVPMERYITIEASEALAQLQSAGKIKTPEDAVREYKRVVLEATESARKLAQTLRGAGKQEAQVRNREVISSQTIAPQSVNTNRQQTTQQQQQPAVESTDDYFSKRRASINAGRNLS